MTSMKKKIKILFWKHMINRVFSRDFCSGMVLFTCRILIGNISRVTFTSSFQIFFSRPLWFHATECCVFRFKSVPTWWLCGPIGACAARLSPARIFMLLSGRGPTGLRARVRNRSRLENRSHVVPKTGFQDGGDRTRIFTHKIALFA